jgi:putative hydrolase of the HAD superfamily
VHGHFAFQLGARELRRGPSRSPVICHAACARLEFRPRRSCTWCDDIDMDVVGAHRAGLRTCWLNRENLAWPHDDVRPDLQFASLAALADWLDAQHQQEEVAA